MHTVGPPPRRIDTRYRFHDRSVSHPRRLDKDRTIGAKKSFLSIGRFPPQKRHVHDEGDRLLDNSRCLHRITPVRSLVQVVFTPSKIER